MSFRACSRLKKPVVIQALVSYCPVKTLDKCIVYRFARSAELKFDSVSIGPAIQNLSGDCRGVEGHRDHERSAGLPDRIRQSALPALTDHGNTTPTGFIRKAQKVQNMRDVRIAKDGNAAFCKALFGDAFRQLTGKGLACCTQ